MRTFPQQPDVQKINDPYAILTAVLLTAFGGLSVNAQPVILGVVADEFSLTSRQIGLIAGAEMLGACLSSFVAVWWVRRVNWRTSATVGLGIFILGNLASMIPETFVPLAMVRGVVGLAMGGLFGLALTHLGDTAHPDRSYAHSVTGQVLVASVALLGIPYLAPSWHYDGVVLLMALGGLLLFPLLHRFPTYGAKVHSISTGEDPVRPSLPFLTGMGVMLAWYVGMGGLWAFLDRIGIASGLEPTMVGQALALGTLVSVSGSMVAAWQDKRFGRTWPFVLTVIGQAGLYAILGGRVNGVTFLGAGLAFGCLWNYGLGFLMAGVAEADRDGRLVVLLAPTITAGLMLGPVLVGWRAQEQSFFSVTSIGIASCMLTLLLFVLFLSLTNHLRNSLRSEAERG